MDKIQVIHSIGCIFFTELMPGTQQTRIASYENYSGSF